MIFDILYIPLIILLGIGFTNLFKKDLSPTNFKALYFLFFFHLLLGVYYCFFIQGDAIGYWRVPKTYNFEDFWVNLADGEGTSFMMAFNFLFTNLLDMSYLSNTLFFSLLGFIGMTFFYLVAVETIPYARVVNGVALFPLIFFLPNLHFWSAGVGKDTTLFLCIGMFTYGLLKPFKRIPLIVLALFLALGIRPHIVLFLLVGFGIAYLLGGKISMFQRIAFSVLLLGAGILLLPSVMEFAKIEEASVAGFEQFAERKATVLSRSHTGSAIDISSYPFPLKVLTFWFRPLFFDARNINGLVASLENLILVVLFFQAMMNKPLRAFKAAPFVIKGLVVFLIVGTLAFSQSLGNLGIMIRMRNMFLPGMMIFILWTFSYAYQSQLEKRLKT